METIKKITVFTVIPEGIRIGLKNALSLLGALVLYILTIWIPYINVGTTIAMATLPIALGKGKVVSPTFIFDSKYRKYMGEYFTLIGLMYIAILPALLFMIVPGIIISIGWSLAVYILLDKEVAPGEAMIRSNKATNGYKWTIFGVSIVLTLAVALLSWLFNHLGILGSILSFLLMLCFQVVTIGCNTVIYKKLVLDGETDSEIIVSDIKTEDGEEIIIEVKQEEEIVPPPVEKKKTSGKKGKEKEEEEEE